MKGHIIPGGRCIGDRGTIFGGFGHVHTSVTDPIRCIMKIARTAQNRQGGLC